MCTVTKEGNDQFHSSKKVRKQHPVLFGQPVAWPLAGELGGVDSSNGQELLGARSDSDQFSTDLFAGLTEGLLTSMSRGGGGGGGAHAF